MSDVKSYEAKNDFFRTFIAYGGTVSDNLRELAALLEDSGFDQRELVAINYAEWDGEHSVTAVVSA